VRPWIVNNPQWLRWMFNLGVDALFTDLPERALALRAEVSGGESGVPSADGR
jgi:glycerophosphoryl diester phosphodiesterase